MELMLDELTQKYFENPIYAKIYLVPFCRQFMLYFWEKFSFESTIL